MQSCRTIDRIPFLIIPQGDGNAYLLRDVIATQWAISLDCAIQDILDMGDMQKFRRYGLRTINGHIDFTSDKIEIINDISEIPSPLDSYSVADLLKVVNKKLKLRVT